MCIQTAGIQRKCKARLDDVAHVQNEVDPLGVLVVVHLIDVLNELLVFGVVLVHEVLGVSEDHDGAVVRQRRRLAEYRGCQCDRSSDHGQCYGEKTDGASSCHRSPGEPVLAGNAIMRASTAVFQ